LIETPVDLTDVTSQKGLPPILPGTLPWLQQAGFDFRLRLIHNSSVRSRGDPSESFSVPA
jgi:hypothetical protein